MTTTPSIKAQFRAYFSEWQDEGHETRPEDYDCTIDRRINDLSLSQFLDILSEVVEEVLEERRP